MKKLYRLLICSLLVLLSSQLGYGQYIFYADDANGIIYRANADGTVATAIVTGLTTAYGVTFDPETNKVYYTDVGNEKICKRDIDGTNLVTLRSSVPAYGIAVDPSGGKMYYTTFKDGDYSFYVANLDGTGTPTQVYTGGDEPEGVALDLVNGKVYFSDPGASIQKIMRCNLDGSGLEDFRTGIRARSLAVYPEGEKLYFAEYEGSYNLKRTSLDKIDTSVSDPLYSSANCIYGVSVDQLNRFVYFTDYCEKKIFKYDIEGGTTTQVGDIAVQSPWIEHQNYNTAPVVNAAPTISIDDATPLSYTENDAATQIAPAATLSDSDGDADWDGGRLAVHISINAEAADEISIPDRIVGNINTNGNDILDDATVIGSLSHSEGTATNSEVLSITFNSKATNALVQQVVRAIHYRNTSDNPGTSNRTITFAAFDKNDASADDTRTISVTAVNDAPTGTNFTANSIYQGTPYVFSTANFGYTDVDGNDMVKIVVNSVPSDGYLYLDADNDDDYDVGEELSNADNVTKADLDNGNLQYYNANGKSSSFEFAVYDGTAYSANPNLATLTVTPKPTVGFTSASQTSAGETGTIDITVRLSNAFNKTVTVPFELTGDCTANQVVDFSLSSGSTNFPEGTSEGNLTIAPGDTEVQLTINILEDALDEENEIVGVRIGTPVNATASGTTNHLATITDDDDPPAVTFTTAAQTTVEGDVNLDIQVHLAALSDKQITVPLVVNGESTATGAGTDYSQSGSTISFFPGDPNDTKSITITIKEDAIDEANETVIVDMGELTNATHGNITKHTITINDDDPAPDVEFSTTSSEGFESVSSANLQVNLSAESGLPISVDYKVNGTATTTGADCLLANGTLSFLAGETSKNITIASIVDNLQDEYDETVIVTLSNPSNAGLGDNTVHTYTIKDDDPTPTIAFTTTSSSGLESVSSAALQVDLSAASGREIRLDYAVTGSATGGGADYTLANGFMIIGVDNTMSNITIASIVNDFLDEDNETVIVTLSNPQNAELGTNTQHTYTIIDDDTVGFTIAESEETTSVAEPNTTDTYTVVLDAQPLSNVVLKVESGDTGEVTVDKASLTFTSANWDVTQIVTVNAADDNLIDGSQNTVITISVDDENSDDAFDALEDQTITVTTTDNDVAGFTLSKTTATITESGTDDSFTVVLDAKPISPVVLNIADGSTDEATLDKTTLSFTGENWNAPQTVTITPVDDYLDDGDQPITLSISVDADGSDNDFDAVANQTVSVISTDDDTADFILSKLSASVAETGTSDSFTAKLTAQPVSDVVLNVVSTDEGEVTVDKATLTFTSDNWNTSQTVSLTGVDDAFADGNQTTMITISVVDDSSDDAFDGVADQNVSCTNTDDEEVGFTLSETSNYTVVKESGTTDEIKVILDGPPENDVVLSVISGDIGEATVSPTSLTFKNANWNTTQTVTVTGVDDVAGDGSQVFNITFSINDGSSDDAFDALEDQTVKATAVDDDVPGITVYQTGGNSIVDEKRTIIDTFYVELNAQPSSNVALSMTSGDTDELVLLKNSMIFTADNWDTPQFNAIRGEGDDLVDGDVTVPLTVAVIDVSSDPAYGAVEDVVINPLILDEDEAAYTVSKSDVTVDETGTTQSFTVVLDKQPLSNVVFNVSSGDTGEATVDLSTLTFTPANYDVAQTVNVTGVNDDLADGSQITSITLNVDADNSQDLWDDLEDKTVSVITTDDDANFTLSKTATFVAEAGTTDEFTVVLNGAPSSNVVLSVVSGDTSEATADQSTLTFTSGNWDSPQTVTITGVDDNLDDGDQSSTITLNVVDGSSDAAFATAADQTVTCSTIDDDVSGFTLAETEGGTEVSESGTTDTYMVVLDAQPVSNVVLNVVSGDTGEATLDKASLTFTSANWSTPQTVTVTGVDDNLIDGNQNTTITISINDGSSDDTFDALLDMTVDVTTSDDDVAGFTLTESDGGTEVSESGSTDTYTLVLDAQPISDVVLSISSGDIEETTLDKASLTFTSANWSTPQTVTVNGIDDHLIDGSQNTLVTISVDATGSDDDFDAVASQTVSVTTFDDDVAGYTLSKTSVSVSESGTDDSFTLVLDAQPYSDVVFNISNSNNLEASLDLETLTFTNSNWNSPQAVTVSSVNDQVDDGDQTSTITIGVDAASSDNAFDDLTNKQVDVIIVDDDETPVITASQSFNVDEDAANSTSVGTVLVNDADAETTYSNWTITGGNTDAVFAINSTSGEITVADNSNLDFEKTTS
eukprot:TRINITY_DN737_c0_g1_i3.p1 TRINITY_DN737_c0_g1~~TRINITY_DN737_c0_g1_i3.p1  ORF type:complete len:2244 (+),score=214.02 TRINITY_DN737_c0_g1_i3:8645-15376(+)